MASSNANRPSRGSSPNRQPGLSAGGEDNPWDQETAEALTRAYEQSEAEWRETRTVRRPRAAEARSAKPDAGKPDAAMSGGAALESRLDEIAERLQQSIAGSDGGKSAAALAQRIDELELRLSAAFEDVAQRLEGRNLEGIEAQIGGLATHLQHTRGQLERLDAIDERLRELAGQLDEHRRSPEASRLDDDRIAALIEAAASRAATRVSESLPQPAASIGPERLDAIEKVLHDEIAERRRAEEITANVLHTIEDALARILDRVDGMEPAGLAAFLPGGRDGARPAPTGDPLLDAYARGAQALGQPTPGSLLDASDYVTSLRRTAAQAAGAFVPAEQAEPLGRAAQEPSADTQMPAAASAAPTETADDDRPGMRLQADARPFAANSGRRSSLLLALVMAALAGAGYMAVDTYLAQLQMPSVSDPAATRQALTSSSMAKVIPVAVSGKEATLATSSIVIEDEGRPSDLAGKLPDGIGLASLRQAVADGDPQAQFEVATRFAEGRGVAKNEAQAFAWYQRAAMRGFVPAQFRVAALFERGVGVTADLERAKVWYRRAAEQGHAKAMHNLAVLSARKDAGGDYAAAAKWFQEAAERGLPDSQYNFAVLCQSGQGVLKNLLEAYKWFAIAARGGDKEAGVRLERVRAQLGAERARSRRAQRRGLASARRPKPAPAADRRHRGARLATDAEFPAGGSAEAQLAHPPFLVCFARGATCNSLGHGVPIVKRENAAVESRAGGRVSSGRR